MDHDWSSIHNAALNGNPGNARCPVCQAPLRMCSLPHPTLRVLSFKCSSCGATSRAEAINPWVGFIDFVAEASSEQLRGLRCPTCRGSLAIRYTDGRVTNYLHVKCKGCGARDKCEGRFEEPPWVPILGANVRT
jgi:hypothetical protein